MSTTGNPDSDNSIVRSVEQDHNGAPAKDSNNDVARDINTLEHAQDYMNADPTTQNDPNPDSAEINSDSVLRGPIHLSHSFSRSCSPVEQQNYRTFRSPINDSRGYYANALRRREFGSASPPRLQRRRITLRLENPSPPHLPAALHDDSSTRAHGASPRPQLGRDQSDVESDEQSPARYVRREASYVDFQSSPRPRAVAGYGGRIFQRECFGGRNQKAQSDPYVGVDTNMEPFDDESNVHNESIGGHKTFSSPSELALEFYRSGSQGPHTRGLGNYDNGVSQGRQGEATQFYHPAQNKQGGLDGCQAIQFNRFRRPSGYREGSGNRKSNQSDGSSRPRQSLTNDADEFKDDRPRASTSAAAGKKRKAVDVFEDGGHFNQPGAGLAPSRYSGDPSVNWGLNQDPPSVPQIAVSDAALLKRGLTRGAKEKVCKRGYGANDPENVNIVNMKEDGMSFAEIVEALNETRVANGHAPSLSVCGVTSRYNRTAPLLFAAEGKQFIPLSKRGKGQVLGDGPLYEKPVWNDQLDLVLAQVVKDIDKDKWARVAMEYNRRTGKNISAQSAALRHTIL
ncbi:hypothetical protein ONS95_001046 [Cadophora gregata]|uniref:uncharacterized protein n=1 Tax=Cadophora gregata TaxID=51156 RepID=UPI0026DB7E0D|nr:uncharacterized protein ONS95_001046 [Cadophora gregata]KAK0129107.1 hypothetical protein ONS95_001046 [Cadophora gregata]